MNLPFVRLFFVILTFSALKGSSCIAQEDTFRLKQIDTIDVPAFSFKKVAELHLRHAIIMIDGKTYLKLLSDERRGLDKTIKSIERIQARKTDPALNSHLRLYRPRYLFIDSMYFLAKRNKSDTIHVDYEKFEDSAPSFFYFLPSAIIKKECIIFSLDNRRPRYIIRKVGFRKTGPMTGVGQSYFFLPDASNYFLSKMDWVS